VDLVLFGLAAVAVFAVGPRLARMARLLADRYGISDVLAGAILLGAVTSLPGLVLTVTAASRGDTELAVSNSLGGVAAQTMFIAIADIVYRRRPLSGAIPTRDVAFQCALLVALLALVVIGVESPGVALGRIHPVTIAIVAIYLIGIRLGSTLDAGGSPADLEGGLSGTRGKVGDEPERADRPEDPGTSNRAAWTRFGLFAVVLTAAGASL
jgi:cation:H+ antiporter